jgi:hypothetical protein
MRQHGERDSATTTIIIIIIIIKKNHLSLWSPPLHPTGMRRPKWWESTTNRSASSARRRWIPWAAHRCITQCTSELRTTVGHRGRRHRSTTIGTARPPNTTVDATLDRGVQTPGAYRKNLPSPLAHNAGPGSLQGPLTAHNKRFSKNDLRTYVRLTPFRDIVVNRDYRSIITISFVGCSRGAVCKFRRNARSLASTGMRRVARRGGSDVDPLAGRRRAGNVLGGDGGEERTAVTIPYDSGPRYGAAEK